MSVGLEIDIKEKLYPAVGDAPTRLIYRDFRLTVAAGSFVALLGSSGIGKTTLINIVAGLDRNFIGRLGVTGGAAPRIGYAFQNPRLLPWRTLIENVALPPGARGVPELLKAVGLWEARDLHPARLSLGMQRRAALARAFAVAPDLMLLDEPFVSLDEDNSEKLRDLLMKLLDERPATTLFVTHDKREAAALASRIVTIAGEPARIAEDIENGARRARGTAVRSAS